MILQENGEIDRKIMADIIFNDPAKREKIDQLTHPLVWEAIRKEAGKHADQPVVIEAAVPSKIFVTSVIKCGIFIHQERCVSGV